MTDLATLDTYGTLSEPATLTIQRLLPGPVERIWAYLTDSDLRRQWLAAGDMDLTLGAPVELVWRNAELTDPPGARPDGFGEEHRMECRITELDPPHRLAITWGSTGGVTFTLERQGSEVLLTVIHRRVADRATLLNVSAGWHAHLDILAARAAGETPEPHVITGLVVRP
ncbi:SRPBCC family protein [Microvirga sp. 2MCAF35]|uniref:SRPBCC family protein n=1 Tax=Microvirga sp. 2MCAF35 TaxID=3232987 RepID=UPI003F9D7DA1